MSRENLEVVEGNQRESPCHWTWILGLIEKRNLFFLIFAPLAVLYLLTASLNVHPHIDPLTNSVAAWYFGMEGTVEMAQHSEAAAEEQIGNSAWIVESPRGPVSMYPPGAAALAAPLYRISGDEMTPAVVTGLNRDHVEGIRFPLPSPAPAAIAASLVTAAAAALVGTTIPLAGGSRIAGLTTGYVMGVATSAWAVAADTLWQHGPAMLWVALGVYLTARSKLSWAGLAFGAAVLTRPHLAVIALVAGVYLGASRRRLRPVLAIGTGSLLGLVILLVFNYSVWGEITISGGYRAEFVDRVLFGDLGWFAGNVAGAILDPWHGLLPYSPFLLLLVPGLAGAWRRSPDWVRAAALGGLLYLLLQLKANRFSGGDGFFGYRYPLEALTVGASILYVSYESWTKHRPLLRRLFWLAASVAAVLQLAAQVF